MTTSRLTSISTTAGGRAVHAVVAHPAKCPAPGLLVLHAFKGLTDEFKDLAVHYADQGYLAVAPDLFDGRVGGSNFMAALRLMFINRRRLEQTTVAWVDWLRATSDCTGKVGTIGWCFGGRWSLNASIATAVDATVIYYGSVDRSSADLARLKGPVQGHFAALDKFIKKSSVDAFDQRMNLLAKPLDLHWYDAQHAFANPGSPWYDAPAAANANARTARFMASHLK